MTYQLPADELAEERARVASRLSTPNDWTRLRPKAVVIACAVVSALILGVPVFWRLLDMLRYPS
jgi:hypothetical protein